MNIIEATKKALETGAGITNPLLSRIGIYLLPTHTYETLRIALGWNPKAEDILSEEWELYGGECFRVE